MMTGTTRVLAADHSTSSFIAAISKSNNSFAIPCDTEGTCKGERYLFFQRERFAGFPKVRRGCAYPADLSSLHHGGVSHLICPAHTKFSWMIHFPGTKLPQ